MDAPDKMPSVTRRKLGPDDVDELANYLKSIPPMQRPSTREAIRMLMPMILELREKKYSLADIADLIRDKGFDLSLNTLRAYVGKEQQRGQREEKTVAKKSRPRDRTSKDSSKQSEEANRRAGHFTPVPDRSV